MIIVEPRSLNIDSLSKAQARMNITCSPGCIVSLEFNKNVNHRTINRTINHANDNTINHANDHAKLRQKSYITLQLSFFNYARSVKVQECAKDYAFVSIFIGNHK